MTAETSNARGEWPERYACNGPEGTFWTDDATLANKMIGAAFDRDEWTVTDTQNPTGAAPSSTAKPEARGVVDEDALRDARTIYDIACIRESRDNATREDVEFKAICLRNYNRIAALTEARNVR